LANQFFLFVRQFLDFAGDPGASHKDKKAQTCVTDTLRAFMSL